MNYVRHILKYLRHNFYLLQMAFRMVQSRCVFFVFLRADRGYVAKSNVKATFYSLVGLNILKSDRNMLNIINKEV